jgi:hypothetical protein
MHACAHIHRWVEYTDVCKCAYPCVRILYPATHTKHTPVLCVRTPLTVCMCVGCVYVCGLCVCVCVWAVCMCVGVTWLYHVCAFLACVFVVVCVCVKGDDTSNGRGVARIRMASCEYSPR